MLFPIQLVPALLKLLFRGLLEGFSFAMSSSVTSLGVSLAISVMASIAVGALTSTTTGTEAGGGCGTESLISWSLARFFNSLTIGRGGGEDLRSGTGMGSSKLGISSLSGTLGS